MPETNRPEYPLVRLHRMGSPVERNDDILLYENGRVEVKISSSESFGFFVFEGEEALTDALLDYLVSELFANANSFSRAQSACRGRLPVKCRRREETGRTARVCKQPAPIAHE